jgi:DivIVA domain-containing protein
VDRDSIARIRSATFPVGRRGYEKREVDRFLNKVADWLETGGGDQTRAEILKRDLERVGQQTAKILTDAHDVAEQLKAEAEQEARRIVDAAAAHVEQARAGAEAHAEKTVANARAEAQRIVDDASQRRADIEALISDLERHHDVVVADLQRLSREPAAAADEHRPIEEPAADEVLPRG